jgi:chromosome segregation ATPase
MSVSLPHPSSRLLRAAAAEQGDLARHRDRLTDRREALLAELRQLDDALTVVDDRLSMLERLTGPPAQADAVDDAHASRRSESVAAARRDGAQTRDPATEVLRGPAIRETAVRVVIGQPQRIEALHYRRWYDLLQEAGYAVAGKDPVAVFLTQVTRSPVVRKATKPGVYEVDRQAPLRIRQRLDRLQTELRELAATPSAPVDLGAVRARRHELDLEISQHERALEEALRVLSRSEMDAAQREATGAR